MSYSFSLTVVTSLCCLLMVQTLQADSERVQGARFSNQPLSANAHLDFEINIGKFLFFRVGDGAYPTASSSVNTVEFEVQPTLGTAEGSDQTVTWGGNAPGLSVNAITNVLPVEVRSNAGQVSIRATASSSLSNGSTLIPLSDINVTSSNPGLPAPAIPATGTGGVVNVTGTQFANLVTIRSANWTFNYTGNTSIPAGVYSGEITFTASAP